MIVQAKVFYATQFRICQSTSIRLACEMLALLQGISGILREKSTDVQSGRRSDGFDGGVLSPYWDSSQKTFRTTGQ